MLLDSPTLLAGTKLGVASENYGATFPPEPSDSDVFEIIGGSGIADGVYAYSATSQEWVAFENNENNPYDIGLTVFDRPRSLDIIAKHLAARTFLIKANFAGSMAKANVAATDAAEISIYRVIDGVDSLVGTLSFAAGASDGVFATINANALIVKRGEILKFVAPELRDATLSSIDITVSGSLFTNA